MHEVGLMQQAVEIVVRHAEREQCHKILEVRLRVGALSGVVPDALEFAFAVSSRGTIAEHAKLEIEEVAVSCECEDCGKRFEPGGDLPIFRCPQCGHVSSNVLSGREFEIASIEVE